MSNDAFVRGLLVDRSLCGPCIARKAEMKVSGMYEAIAWIGRTRKTRMTIRRSDECEREAIVHRIGQVGPSVEWRHLWSSRALVTVALGLLQVDVCARELRPLHTWLTIAAGPSKIVKFVYRVM